VLWTVVIVTTGWVETASGLLAALLTFLGSGPLLGLVSPTERGKWHWG
jgi:hypothetical protein